jgi:hypothetical protein
MVRADRTAKDLAYGLAITHEIGVLDQVVI